MKIIILAGGNGTRLWPVSRDEIPKQFLRFGEGDSLLQKTLRRFLRIYQAEDLLIVTQKHYAELTLQQVREVDPLLCERLLFEPAKRSTAPAIALAARFLLHRQEIDEHDALLIAPSDHWMRSEEPFLQALPQVENLARLGAHVTFGVLPTAPETGYGYLRCEKTQNDSVLKVTRFIEKPSFKRAEQLLAEDNVFWNAGIFAFQYSALKRDLQQFQPALFEMMQGPYKEFEEGFHELPDVSIDYALMEQSENVLALPLNVGWSDVGSWDRFYDLFPKDKEGNAAVGNAHFEGCSGCFAMGQEGKTLAIDVEDLLIVRSKEALLVAKRGSSQKVGELIKQHALSTSAGSVYRPWGHYLVMEERSNFKVKRIVVSPKQKLSLQRHLHRSEHWVVVSGRAEVTIGEELIELRENEGAYVPQGALHRIENVTNEPLEIVEVQVGAYVGEDDIERFDDIYGRSVQSSINR